MEESPLPAVFCRRAAIRTANLVEHLAQRDFCLKKGIYREVLLAHRFTTGKCPFTQLESWAETVARHLILETMAETRFQTNVVTRISRVFIGSEKGIFYTDQRRRAYGF